jgi:EF hand
MYKYLVVMVVLFGTQGFAADAVPTATAPVPAATAPVKNAKNRPHYNRADMNKDGKVTRQEYLAAAAARFDKMDKNHDNVLSTDEFPHRTYRKK